MDNQTDTILTTVEALEARYGEVSAPAIRKVADHMTPEYTAWMEASPFCALATVGPEGADASPRGDRGQVVWLGDDRRTLLMPDWRGNNRMDSLRNIVRDGRVALMFLVPGADTVLRVNGRAVLSVAPAVVDRFTDRGAAPRSVIVITVGEVYFQCARAVIRAGIWDQATWGDISVLPTPGQILKAMTAGELDGDRYDREWPARMKKTLW
ncbi:MAG: pyridoxamine 5'-phosphate oxidase family protein [Pseudomonadota bacterium]